MDQPIDGTYTLSQTESAIAQEEAFGKQIIKLAAIQGSVPPVNDSSFQKLSYVPNPIALVDAPDDAAVKKAIADRGGHWAEELRANIFIQSVIGPVALLRQK